ncbi:MAG TPA: DUF2141 domain-containing protein [Polyangiaceae bacterium]|nr:DUF2141 domain-containing protein [Polyangiaceae bacterium]
MGAWLCGVGHAAADAERATLTVNVSELRNSKGNVAVALFDSPSAFPDQQRALVGKLAKIDGRTASLKFVGLKPGTYAVAVLHDENRNDKMDFNLLGMPLEGYGFSNDAQVMFAPPSFDEAAFRLLPRASQISIPMHYFSIAGFSP